MAIISSLIQNPVLKRIPITPTIEYIEVDRAKRKVLYLSTSFIFLSIAAFYY